MSFERGRDHSHTQTQRAPKLGEGFLAYRAFDALYMVDPDVRAGCDRFAITEDSPNVLNELLLIADSGLRGGGAGGLSH